VTIAVATETMEACAECGARVGRAWLYEGLCPSCWYSVDDQVRINSEDRVRTAQRLQAGEGKKSMLPWP